MLTEILASVFNLDALAKIMIGLVFFIGSLVWIFSCRYMLGDRHYARFLFRLFGLCVSVLLLLMSDNLILFFLTWCLSNFLLVRLMIHKSEWSASKISGMLAAKNFILGAICLAGAFQILYLITGSMSIQTIIQIELHPTQQLTLSVALVLMLLAAMAQSAIWPFHRWLLSSLNSPTPVSAIMHAGLINGGGFLLARFGQLFIMEKRLLLAVFSLGLISAIVGTVYKLIQSDIKKMLACSTMAQMGFMLMQCGLGLFPAAVAHLCWHGLFKATLFLGAGSAAQDKKEILTGSPNVLILMLSILCGTIGSYFFALSSGKEWFSLDTTFVLVVVAFLTAAQFSLTLLRALRKNYLPLAVLLSVAVGSSYGLSVSLITYWLVPLHLSEAQPLNVVHILAISMLALGWLAIQYKSDLRKIFWLRNYLKPLFVKTLNASQPHPSTITTHRNHYHY